MTSILKKTLASAIGATLIAAAAPAAAAVTATLLPGTSSPVGGYTVINTLTSGAGITGSGFLIKSGSDGQGAAPAFAAPGSGTYLSVLGGGSATITFLSPAYSFEFDTGSSDPYNSFLVTWTGGSQTFFGGGDGSQSNPVYNGVTRVTGSAGEQFVSVRFMSSQNSFEIDNLAVIAVPEPSTWAMLLCGFGLVGAAMRRRHKTTVVFA